ncbi:hypothetical protein E3Q22_02363 [Wallemia mellicola]|uniref:pH-response regulator protein palC n=2 Tax=Wallemia mellicola TaxID=1708541 RepID=A0A4T0PPB4_9BASI|nr:hypothetical protein WALSEDRAFT_56832 [Wallemia mellicola CBS 633.66]TIB71417.1 hypothetical protein E3Q24_02335 [Wallemia mellicola]EIM22667.1 hypothetical protein WALSEDRAFT_56832 [Wallemia mellicola CBS 633.66]TIB76099.1 hypothetical protein E3Q23_02015 [Wallemia mellicola]TIB79676.1 hypothetical protein E3Q22_02363 [Wallemia mellicola]TIB83796.1 hypothetical protein E3Q21_02692 [Wallemia mellicola]|eukprot:XP_006957332.1 hypothetical protein WALSEDRAFT_56832 [Wallemia mellicola CBS 633.66]
MRLQYPSTQSIWFTRFFTSTTSSDYSSRASESTAKRAHLCAALKSDKNEDLNLISSIQEYLPHLLALEKSALNDSIVTIADDFFLWTVPSQLSPKGKSTSSSSLTFEVVHVLHVHALALFNHAQGLADKVGSYDSNPLLPDSNRKECEDILQSAVSALNLAAGMFKYISDTAIDNYEGARDADTPILNREYNIGLSKLSLAVSQSLAIRKLMSPHHAYTLQNPGPPLPKAHPSPQILLKLHLDTSSLYNSSRMMLKSSIKSTLRVQHVDLPAELKAHTKRREKFHAGVAKKWLGVDAANSGHTGLAIAWLKAASEELAESVTSSSSEKLKILSKSIRKARDERKNELDVELSSIDTYFKAYKQLNDTVHFQDIPPSQSLLSQIPSGRSLVAATPYTPPPVAWVLQDTPEEKENTSDATTRSTNTQYALQGKYF